MSVNNKPRRRYTVGILCALDKELLAVRALFDEKHPDIPTNKRDTNHYVLGRIGRHNVVTTCLPAGEYGIGAASEVVQNLLRSFLRVEFCLLVGIGGGVPSLDGHDIRLGDVVVSHPDGRHPAVLQYDMGKFLGDGDFEITGTLQSPPRMLMKAISKLKSNPDPKENSLRHYLETIGNERPAYRSPGPGRDILYDQDSQHMSGPDCRNCIGRVNRTARVSDQPQVHYGPIASANQVMRSANQRDRLAAKHRFLCFEMEAAGVMNATSCLVIRGVCDYADSHKNKVWQEYASAAAASYAKLLLSVLRDHVRELEHEESPFPIESASGPSKENPQSEKMDTLEDVGSETPDLRIRFDLSAFIQEFHPVENPEDVLQKYFHFSNRRPSWNPWPKDYCSLRLFRALSEWISNPQCSLLAVRRAPGRLSHFPAPEDLACHLIRYFKTKTKLPVIWSFSFTPQTPENRNQAIKILIVQALKISNQSVYQEVKSHLSDTKEQLLEILYCLLCQLKRCFVVIEMKDATLATDLLTVIRRAANDSRANFKATMISCHSGPKEKNTSIKIVSLPSIKLRGSIPGCDVCWNSVRPEFK